jgi:hypothetical protein
MFFVETLGPAITPRKAQALFAFVKSRTGSKTSVPAAELQAIVSEFVRLDGSRFSTEAAIKFLANRGRISAQDARTFRIAA